MPVVRLQRPGRPGKIFFFFLKSARLPCHKLTCHACPLDVLFGHDEWLKWTGPTPVPVTSCPCEIRTVVRFLTLLFDNTVASIHRKIHRSRPGMKPKFGTIPQRPKYSHFCGDERPSTKNSILFPTWSFHSNYSRWQRFGIVNVSFSMNSRVKVKPSTPRRISTPQNKSEGKRLKPSKGNIERWSLPFPHGTPDLTRTSQNRPNSFWWEIINPSYLADPALSNFHVVAKFEEFSGDRRLSNDHGFRTDGEQLTEWDGVRGM